MKIRELGIQYYQNDQHNQLKKKVVNFNQNVSIITGQSKKGKSAILEIVDFCLFSSRNIVPEGVVRDRAKGFVLSLSKDNLIINLYRCAKTLKMKIECFDSNEEQKTPYNFDIIDDSKETVQKEFETLLGINISKEDIDNLNIKSISKPEKYSIRYQVPYNLLAQNIIANKDVLFRNFSESRYRKKMKEEFKFFFGLESLEDYILNQEIQKKRDKLKKRKRLYEYNQEEERVLLGRINLFLESYNLSSIDRIEKFYDIEEVIETKSEKREYTADSYKKLLTEMQELKAEINVEEKNLQNDKYLLEKIKIKDEVSGTMKSKIEARCPICDNVDESYSSFMKELELSEKKYHNFIAENKILETQLQKNIVLTSTSVDKKREKIKELQNEKLRYLENELTGFDSQNFFRQYYQLKMKVDILNGITDSEIKKLEDEIKELSKKRRKANTKEFQKKLNENLTEIVQMFDIEDDYRRMNLEFDINSFDYYFSERKHKIHISNTGSGANWLSMHLALNISLIKTVKDLGLKSSLFSFLILDQPTQAYFTTDNKTGELDTVIKMFASLFKIANDNGIQIIILEHAKCSDFSSNNEMRTEFQSYEIENWHDENSGLLENA